MDIFSEEPACRTGVLTKKARNKHEELIQKIPVKKDGYIETFLVNETSENVWFDQFRIQSTGPLIVQETHYDAWGLEIKELGYQYGGIKENPYLYNGKEFNDHLGVNLYDYGARMYDATIGRWGVVDPMAEMAPSLTPYRYGFNNPISFIDPDGKFEYSDGYSTQDSRNTTGAVSFSGTYSEGGSSAVWLGMNYSQDKNGNRTSPIYRYMEFADGSRKNLSAIGYSRSPEMYGVGNLAASGGGSQFADGLSFIDKHFNGGLGTISVAVQGYSKIPNDVKRNIAHKLSKQTGIKSGKIFQGVKSIAKTTEKVVGKLGFYGTALGVGVIGYDLLDDGHLKSSSIVNGALIGIGFAFPVTAPFILIYGVIDYTKGIGDGLDRSFGTLNTHIYD